MISKYTFQPGPVTEHPHSTTQSFRRKAARLSYRHYGQEGLEGILSIRPAVHTPALRMGQQLLCEQPLVLLGMSPGNAFFTRKRIEIAICGFAQLVGDVTVVVPDSISIHTYRALGYSEQDCVAKARRNGNDIKKRCLKAMEKASSQSPQARLHLLDWDRDIATLKDYEQAYLHVCDLYESNAAFRHEVLEKGRSVLCAKLNPLAVTEPAVQECIEYLLKEFAYLHICRQAHCRDLVMPYHQDFTLAQRFCDGTYGKALPGTGWLIFDISLVGEELTSIAPQHNN